MPGFFVSGLVKLIILEPRNAQSKSQKFYQYRKLVTS